MTKVKLELDSLTVESFATDHALRAGGTVLANSRVSLFAPEGTCGNSCLEPNSCAGTCYCTYNAGC
ncbi:MAG TPA: hypothetical protein VF705_12385 [Longimicrobium sp.]